MKINHSLITMAKNKLNGINTSIKEISPICKGCSNLIPMIIIKEANILLIMMGLICINHILTNKMTLKEVIMIKGMISNNNNIHTINNSMIITSNSNMSNTQIKECQMAIILTISSQIRQITSGVHLNVIFTLSLLKSSLFVSL